MKEDIIIFDVESTGLNKKNNDYIVELSAIKYRQTNGKMIVIDEINLFMKPPFHMDEKIVSIHGITNEFLNDKKTEKELFPLIQKFFGNHSLLIGHNVDFDIQMMQTMYQRNGSAFQFWTSLDTIDMARDVLFGKEIKNYKLDFLVPFLGLDLSLKFHCAMDDVKATYRLLKYCHEEYKKTLEVNEPKQKLYINYVYFWEGYNKNQKGTYVDTNAGKIFFSTFDKAWMSSNVVLSNYDIDSFENEVLHRIGCPNVKELGKMTEKKFKELKKS